MKNPDSLWFPSGTPVWCCQVVSAHGGGQSALGATPEDATARAGEVVKRLGSAKWMAAGPYLVSESVKFPGVWDTTPTPEVAAQIAEYTKGRKDE